MYKVKSVTFIYEITGSVSFVANGTYLIVKVLFKDTFPESVALSLMVLLPIFKLEVYAPSFPVIMFPLTITDNFALSVPFLITA